MIVIVDYGMGNVGSILNMLSRVDVPAVISRDPEVIRSADKLVLPGVGAFDAGMHNLRELGLVEILRQAVQVHRKPLLGICLGMQLLTEGSEEGSEAGLGWVAGRAIRFDPAMAAGIRVPHMGWNSVTVVKPSPLFEDMYPDPRFYFVHSYHVVCDRTQDVLCVTRHGPEFCSAFAVEHVFGVQFHPEKSHKFGMRLLESFARL
jgi:glutamine amidotransferase